MFRRVGRKRDGGVGRGAAGGGAERAGARAQPDAGRHHALQRAQGPHPEEPARAAGTVSTTALYITEGLSIYVSNPMNEPSRLLSDNRHLPLYKALPISLITSSIKGGAQSRG